MISPDFRETMDCKLLEAVKKHIVDNHGKFKMCINMIINKTFHNPVVYRRLAVFTFGARADLNPE